MVRAFLSTRPCATVDEADLARKERPQYTCLTCEERVVALKGGSDGLRHFEHLRRQKTCARSSELGT